VWWFVSICRADAQCSRLRVSGRLVEGWVRQLLVYRTSLLKSSSQKVAVSRFMNRKSRHNLGTSMLEPSPLVRRFAPLIATALAGKAVLDVACGSGRNAMTFAQLGCDVICVDKDLNSLQAHRVRLRRTSLKAAVIKIRPHQIDLVRDPWPFTAGAFGGIINVHFLVPGLFQYFESSLSPGGYLLIPGSGVNLSITDSKKPPA
jgi:SAM-dependent methyltransferase